MERWTTPGSVFAGAVAALGASACCAGPLVLVLLGVSGAWSSRLVAMEPLQPYLVAIALAFFGFAFYRLYRTRNDCAPAEACVAPVVCRGQRVIFWIVAVIAAAMMAFPLYAPLFY